MAAVETRLREITAVEQHSLATVAAGGKRLRPLLVFVAGLGSDAHGELSRAAAAVELIHSATLVHDDVLDDAPLRRGRRTVFAAAGRAPRPRPATCCSRARSPSSRATARSPSCARCRRPPRRSPAAS